MERTNLPSMDKAFEWLVLFLTVLFGVIFQFLTWVLKPESLLGFTAKLMLSMTMPLILLLFAWFYRLLTLDEEHRISLGLFSWGSVSMVLSCYVMLFLTLAITAIFNKFAVTAIIALLGGTIAISLVPSKRIFTIYKASTLDNRYWEQRGWKIAFPYIIGVCLTGLLILLPLLLP